MSRPQFIIFNTNLPCPVPSLEHLHGGHPGSRNLSLFHLCSFQLVARADGAEAGGDGCVVDRAGAGGVGGDVGGGAAAGVLR